MPFPINLPVYTVHAFRFGDRERHSYLVGVFSLESAARCCAEREEAYRGGKYSCEIRLWTVDEKAGMGLLDDLEAERVIQSTTLKNGVKPLPTAAANRRLARRSPHGPR